MKRKMQRVLALILSLVMCLGLCPVGAFAAEPALSAELSKTTMTAGTAETITLTVKLGETTEKLSLMDIDVFSEDANGTDAGFSPVEDGLSVAGGQGNATLNTTTKHINWISVTELTGISTLLTVKVSVPATAKAGTYKIGVKNVTIGDDTEDWMSDGTAYATLTIEEPAASGYSITVNTAENGTVTADKDEAAEGETVTLTVTPSAEYKLQTLTVAGAEVTKVDDTTYTFVMPASDVTVSAVFAQAKKLTIKINGEGTVTADMASAYVGEKITFTITPAEGYRLGYIRIAGIDHTASVVDGKLEYTLGNNTGLGVYVEATFVPEKLTVVVSGYEAGKSVTTLQASESALGLSFTYGMSMGICTAQSVDNLMESGSFETGKDYWLLLTSENNSFAGYTAADISVTGVENAVVTVEETEGTAFVWIKLPQLAAATPTTYGITVSAGEGGTVTADKAEAAEGETVTLTVEAAEGYELDTLTYTAEGEVAVDIKEAKSFTMPAKAVTVAATFKAVEVASPKVVLKLEGYEVMADAASITLSGEDCNFLDSNGIYTTMNTGTKYKASGSLLPGTQYYLYFNFNSISDADWSTLTKDDVQNLGMICGGACDVFFHYLPAGDAHTLALVETAEAQYRKGADLWLLTDVTTGGKMGLYTEDPGTDPPPPENRRYFR